MARAKGQGLELNALATAASKAFPPFFSILIPDSEANGCAELTTPFSPLVNCKTLFFFLQEITTNRNNKIKRTRLVIFHYKPFP